ncbi:MULTISPECIES: type II toxin-antitoxin system VapB family antitoxin [unclassified Ensifer]|uniref:type II toxin-antitoxin system VapB family antitoxin n=1 Tax=unclassified Ensifer TaxID=2633371 RepID=UPI000813820E|nr:MULTISPECIES: type II toxin-antitoxin system VapB family antitoxin [unclassified Ensifer]OCP19855.1 histidinol dehydrogenase [Ensifer sp. LC384]OCP20534.1 histidinol dehydrogenase [Ensifer sp. LC54]OCP35723.1 histidinol dehydrogenase [Ensifer sp. LC163]
MALYIRDDTVDDLASELQKLSKAPNKTEAVRRALQHELDRIRQEVPLRERVAKIQDKFRARMGSNKPNFDMKRFTDEMWEL